MAKLPLEMTIAQQDMTLRDVVELEEGDVIPIELPEPFQLKANKVPVFNCTMGVSRGNLALKITDQIIRPK
jgi:flagellar motor switch protein FliM